MSGINSKERSDGLNDLFTVNLISSASMEYYPDNKLSKFRTVLPMKNGLDLSSGAWEVALSEIVFPAMMNNITDGGEFRFRNYVGDDSIPSQKIGNGSYRSVADVMDAMMDKYSPHYRTLGSLWTYSVNPVTRILSIKLNNQTAYLEIISNDLSTMLGIPNNGQRLGVGPHKSAFPVDMQRAYTMFVYTDIIEPQIVGDTLAPLLRSVAMYSSVQATSNNDILYCRQTQIVKAFDHLEFKRVSGTTINTILIELHNETGQLMQFIDIGRVSLTLLFRRNKSN